MNTKELIEYICKDYQEILTINNDPRKIVFFLGLKPESYCVPQLVTTKMALSGRGDEILVSLYAEIFLGNVCLFRECFSAGKKEDLMSGQEQILKRLLLMITRHGISSVSIQMKAGEILY